MDRKRIIEDGLLEDYILGLLAHEEEEALQDILVEDPVLKEKFSDLESDLERVGFENAIDPPSQIKEKLRKSLDLKDLTKEISITVAKAPSDTLQSGKLLVAASLAALFALASFWFYIQWDASMDSLQSLQKQTVDLQQRLDNLERQYENTQERYVSINSPDVIPLYLVGNNTSPESRAVAFVNHKDKTVIVNGLGLVPLETNKSYQMWADVEGEMINMGLVPADQEYIPLRYIDKAESLNITIEPAGGSEHPSVENLISNIYL